MVPSSSFGKRALGANPMLYDTSGQPTLVPASTNLTFTFHKARTSVDLDLVVQVSQNLNTTLGWQDAKLDPAPNADGQLELINDSLPDVQVFRFTSLHGVNQCFYRIVVRQR